jgi:hypothetical protein
MADHMVDARSKTEKAPDEKRTCVNSKPANESLLTDVSRLRSFRCTIIASINPLTEFVERTGCGALRA